MAIIAIDLDGVLVNGDKALEGAREAINILREQGHKIIVHSCNRLTWVHKVLQENNIPYDHVWGDSTKSGFKPLADLYIDDKGYHFPYNGNWAEELPKIMERIEGLDNSKW